MELKLVAASPFSLAAVVNSHGWIQLAPFAEGEDGTFSYVTRLSSGRVLRYQAASLDGGLSVTTAQALDKEGASELAQQVRWTVGLDQDLAPFYEHVRDHPKLGHVVNEARGRLLRSPTLFEDVVKTILTTNTTWAGTRRMTGNLVAQFGEPLPDDGAQRAFPTPQRLAQTTAETLREETGLGYRAPYVLALAQAVDAGELELEALKDGDLPTEELRRELLKLKGVGSYAAANLLLLLGRYDFIPIDSWALRMVSQEWHKGEPIGPAEVEAAFEAWGEWKGLAYWFWDWAE